MNHVLPFLEHFKYPIKQKLIFDNKIIYFFFPCFSDDDVITLVKHLGGQGQPHETPILPSAMFSLKAFCISIIVIIVNILAMIVISATRLQEKPTRGAVPMKELLLSSQPCTKRTCKPLLSSLPSTIMMVKTNLSCANTLRRLSLCPHSSPRTSPHGNVQQHFRVFKWMCHIQGVFFSLALPLNTLSTKKVYQG